MGAFEDEMTGLLATQARFVYQWLVFVNVDRFLSLEIYLVVDLEVFFYYFQESRLF